MSAEADATRRLGLIFDALDELIISMDADGRIRSCNVAAARALGIQNKEDVIGKTLMEVGFVPVDAAGSPIAIDRTPAMQAHRTGVPQRTPAIGLQRPDKSTLWVRLLVTLLPGVGEVALVATDVTEEVRRERRLETSNAMLEARVAQRTAELGVALAELESFSYSVAHDLRSLINSIALNTELAQVALAEPEPGEVEAALARVASAAQRMSDLTSGLLSLARATRSDLARRPIDLAEIARAEFARLRADDPTRNVRISVPPSIPAYGDRHLLAIVMQNLLENAWKFTARTHTPEIEVGETEIDGERTFFVRDTGIGFDNQNRDIFAPFQRLHDDSYAGTGIGLTTVHRIITRHGGRVWAQSRPGHGATIFFILPELPEHQADAHAPAR